MSWEKIIEQHSGGGRPPYADASSPLFYDRYGVEHNSQEKPFPIEMRFGVFGVLNAHGHVLLNYPAWAEESMKKGGHNTMSAELPGGGLDNGEGVTDALYREVEEETGLRILRDQSLGPAHINDFYMNMYAEDIDTYYRYLQRFYYYYASNHIRPEELKEEVVTEEGSRAFWHPLDKIDELTLRFGHAHIIHQTVIHKCIPNKVQSILEKSEITPQPFQVA